MWLLKIFTRRKKLKMKYEIEKDSYSILPKELQEEFIKSKKDREMDILIEVYKPKSRGKMETSFKSAWRKLERVDQIETLISLEKELAARRKEISSDLYKDSKGKW
jgi:thymidylate synthase